MSARLRARRCHFLTLKSDEFIGGRWNSGQLVPASVTATTWARNVTAGHPCTADSGGNVDTRMKRTRTLREVSRYPFHEYTHKDYKQATRNNSLPFTLLVDHLIPSGGVKLVSLST